MRVGKRLTPHGFLRQQDATPGLAHLGDFSVICCSVALSCVTFCVFIHARGF